MGGFGRVLIEIVAQSNLRVFTHQPVIQSQIIPQGAQSCNIWLWEGLEGHKKVILFTSRNF